MKMLVVLLVIVLLPLTAMTHPGKTDLQGGHKCYKECAEWDLYYAEYHLHDKAGKPVKAARKRPVRPKPEGATVEKNLVIEEIPAAGPVQANPSQPVVFAAVAADEPAVPMLPWLLLILCLLLIFIVRRNRRKASDEEPQ